MAYGLRYHRGRNFVIVVCTLFFIAIFLQLSRQITPRIVLQRFAESVKVISNTSSGISSDKCIAPLLHANDPSIMRFVKSVPNPVCNDEKDWTYTSDNALWIRSKAEDAHGKITCETSSIIRKSDTKSELIQAKKVISNGSALDNDFFEVRCRAADGAVYNNMHPSIKKTGDIEKRQSAQVRGPGYNVLMLGIDSMSRMSFLRKLPKSYSFFETELGGTILENYNIVGDGTPQALIPILTGKTELELPRALKRLKKPVWVDVFPFVWKEYTKRGYVTAWSEDNPGIGTFTYRMVGFNKQPTDHYMRTFYIHAEPKYKHHRAYCLGSRTRYQVHLDWFKEFFSAYNETRKFGFGFNSELSHSNNNAAGIADIPLLEFLQWMKSSGQSENTVIILMSDHGARFDYIRESVVGKLEERLPMFGIALPKRFREDFPELYKNFVENSKKLLSPFDIYPTLRDIVDRKGKWKSLLKHRSISLFDVVPNNRTCSDSDIEPHWCTCLGWKEVSGSSADVQAAGQAVVNYLNEELRREAGGRCAELKLNKILKAATLEHEKNMLKFKKTNDLDGYRADLSSNTLVAQKTYQITLETIPGTGHFEVTLTREIKSGKWKVSSKDVSRVNKYGTDASCVENNQEQLRKFCYCLTR